MSAVMNGGLWSDLWLLLTLRWQTALNGFRGRTAWRQALTVVGVIVVAVATGSFTAGIGAVAAGLLRRFPHAQLDSLLPGVILTAVALLLLVSSFGVSLGSLFLSSDMDLLMTAPVDRRAVFISKLLDGVATNYAILAVTALPALISYGIVLRYGPLYFVLMILAVIGTPLLPEGLGALLVLLIARFAPARRVREVLALFAALFGLSMSLLGQTSRFWMGNLGRGAADPAALKTAVADLVNIPIPFFVAGRGLTAAGQGDVAGALLPIGGYLVLTFGFFAGCVLVADRLYAAGWVRMQGGGSASRSRKRVARDAATSGWLGRAPAYLAVALKDWRVLPRDLRNFAQIIGPIVMLPVLYLNLLGGGGRRSFDAVQAASQLTRGRVDPSGVFVAFGILTACILICTQLTATAISMEGKSYWLLKAAPISGRELARGKFLAAWAPFVILSTVLLVIATVWRGFSVLGFLYGWFGIEVLGASLLAISLGCGMRWPRLNWENPKQMHNGWSTLVTFLAEAILGLLGGALLCLPLVAQVLAPEWLPVAWIGGIAGTVLLAGGLAAAALAIGLEHLPNVGEA